MLFLSKLHHEYQVRTAKKKNFYFVKYSQQNCLDINKTCIYVTWQSVLRTILDKIGNSVLNSILCLVPLYLVDDKQK